MSKIVIAVSVIFATLVTSTPAFAKAEDFPPVATYWFFLIAFGIALGMCSTFLSEEMEDGEKKTRLVRFILLPTFYTLVVLYCISLVGMVASTTITIIIG